MALQDVFGFFIKIWTKHRRLYHKYSDFLHNFIMWSMCDVPDMSFCKILTLTLWVKAGTKKTIQVFSGFLVGKQKL